MQMINVLKRLAELDAPASSPAKMVNVTPLTTVGAPTLAECGVQSLGVSPSSISVTAGSGPELSGILRDMMSLAGISQSNVPPSTVTVVPSAHGSTGNDSMANLIGMIDDAEDTADEPHHDEEDMEEERRPSYDNSPNERVSSIDPDQLVQGGKSAPRPAINGGDNPLARMRESTDVASASSKLFKDYKQYVAESEARISEISAQPARDVSVKRPANMQASVKASDAANTSKVRPRVREGSTPLGSTWSIHKESRISEDTHAEVDADDVASLAAKLQSGEISYNDFKEKLASLENPSRHDENDAADDRPDGISESTDTITHNGKEIDPDSIVIDGIYQDDEGGLDFTETYIDSASYMDGTQLTVEELEDFDNANPTLAQTIAAAQHADDEDETHICPACSGSGEGQYDGTRCNSCNGRGEL